MSSMRTILAYSTMVIIVTLAVLCMLTSALAVAQNNTFPDKILAFTEVFCTRNEYACPKQQTCLQYSWSMCYMGSCGDACLARSCSDCPGEQLCMKISVHLSYQQTKCYCRNDKLPTANGTCNEAPDYCSGPLKDRYCDQACTKPSSNITCSCAEGFKLDYRKGKFGDKYGACVPVSDGLGDQKIIMNGPRGKEWNALGSGLVRLDAVTSVDRVQIRPTQQVIQQIYAITNDSKGRHQLTLFSAGGHKTSHSYPMIYSLNITDFAMDWPTGNVYYLSATDPVLTVCNITGTVCRILAAGSKLISPREMVIDSTLQCLLVADNSAIWRISLDGLKATKMPLPSNPSKLTLDFDNHYLHYVAAHDGGIYRMDYKLFNKADAPQKILVLRKTAHVGKIVSMATIGRELYIVEYFETLNKSVIYHNMTTNPYQEQAPKVFVFGPGKIKNILIYHKSLVRLGPSLNSVMPCHLTLQGKCTCMEGFELQKSNRTCTQVDLKDAHRNLLLYTSAHKVLIQGIYTSDSMTCPPVDLGTVPINPIRIQHYSRKDLDIHLGYDPVDNVIYYSDETAIRKASASGLGDRVQNTGWTAEVGTIIYGMAINPSLRLMYYAEYSRIKYLIVVSSLTRPNVQAKYTASPNVGHRYFSTALIDSGYEFRMIDAEENLPILSGDSMMHKRSSDPNTGYFYDLGFGTTNANGYSYLSPNATSTSRRSRVRTGDRMHSLSSGDKQLLYFASDSRSYGVTNTTDYMSLVCDDIVLRTVMYARTSVPLKEVPAACKNCTGLCLERPAGNYSCGCHHEAATTNHGICHYEKAQCEGGEMICPGTTKCLDKSKVCDKVEDCDGGNDESHYAYCPVFETKCAADEMKCGATSSPVRCIPKSQHCDGIKQCPSGEDEEQCPASKPCPEFQCPNSGVCYSAGLKCDGISDCPEYSGEHYSCIVCHSTAFLCPNSFYCVPNFKKCDGYSDCADGSDEKDCAAVKAASKCAPAEKKCDSGQCIPEIWWCDGASDCIDHSDEHHCANVSCTTGFIKCNDTGQCIPHFWRCDAHEDCIGGEDEVDCSLNCSDHQFTCPPTLTVNRTTCISRNKLCDSHKDCAGGDDEDKDICSSGACLGHPCSHTCVIDPAAPQGRRCTCPAGSQIFDSSICVPMKRTCGDWGACSQQCVNIFEDQIKCTCHKDYDIQPDFYTCAHHDGPASLIFSNRHDLRLLPTHPSSQYSELISSLRNTIAVDYHYEKKYVFWSDVIADKIYRGTRDPASDSGALVGVVAVITNGLPTAEGLAVDWIGNHIYWVESGLDIIDVADLDGNNRTTIISHSDLNPMENPRSIAVDPRVGLLFWADWGIKQIRRATMAGKNQMQLFSVNHPDLIKDGGWANGLTLDYDMKRVYWNDAKSDTIQTVDYEGQDFHLVLSNNDLLVHPFAISVFENWVYWSDWRKNSINRANKWNGTNAQVVQSTVTQPFDLKVYHKGRQPPMDADTEDACAVDNGGCSHLCLRNSNSSVQCACPHLLQLDTDMKSCRANAKFLLLSMSSFVTSLSLQPVNAHGVMPTLAAPIIERVYQVDYYITTSDTERRLFWADEGLKAIATSSMRGSGARNIVDLGQALEYGFAVDYVNKKLYLTTYSLRRGTFGTIDVCDFNGSRRATITTGLQRPKKIVLQPSNGTMFVIDEGANAIYSMYMNGSFASANKSASNILTSATDTVSSIKGMQIALSRVNYRKSVLYFGNASHIYQYDGKNVTLVIDNNPEAMTKWTVDGDLLYFVSKFKDTGFEVKKRSLVQLKTSAVRVGLVKGNMPQDIKMVDSTRTVLESDRVKCSDCNHHCLPRGRSQHGEGTCVCYTGYRYQANKCQAVTPMLLYTAILPKPGIYGLDLSSLPDVNSTNSLPGIPRIYKPTSVGYYHSDNSEPDYIYWIDSGNSITRTTRDLINRKTIVSGLIAARDLAIDPQGDNLYWVDSFTGTIEVCRTDGSQRLVLVQADQTHDNKLLSVSVHPSKGYLYYLESKQGVFRMTLGHTRTTTLVAKLPAGGHALAVDIVNQRLFVCNGLHQIMYMDIDGNTPQTVFSVGEQNCSAIAVSGHLVYYDVQSGIYLKNITSMESAKLLVRVIGGISLALAQRDIYKHLGANPCSIDNGGCAGLCLFNGNTSDSSHCVCAMGVLDANGTNCDDLQDFVVFSKVNAIEYHRVTSINTHQAGPYPPLSSNMTMNVIALATDPQRQRIYFSDIQRRALSWALYNGTVTKDILTNIDSVEGLAYDNDHLYFTYQSKSDATLPAIKYINVAKEHYEPKVVINLAKSDAPRAIAVHSCSGYIFWTNWNEANPSIQRAETSGAHFTSIITKNIVIPNGLAIDHKMEKLFWADANLDKIEMCDFLGHNCVIVLNQVSPHIFAMAIHGDYLYWTDWMQRAVRMAHKLYGSLNQTLVAKLPRQPMGIAIASTSSCKDNLCYRSPCEQICKVVGGGEGYVCSCFPGYVVDPSNVTTCLNLEGCKDDAFACQGDCIPWELTCDGINHCLTPDAGSVPADEHPLYCATRKCPINKYITCHNQRCVPISANCDGFDDCGDLTDELNCTRKACNNSQFTCNNHQCIPATSLCDGKPQCWDKSDELPPHCNSTKSMTIDCSEFENPFYGTFKNGIKCANTPVCIMDEWKCDGHNDCWDNWDEVDCDKPESCSGEDEWECVGDNSQDNNVKQCIVRSWRCDGDIDCADESDEMNCATVECPEGDFTCVDKMCIPHVWACDGKPDCSDGSDEKNCSSSAIVCSEKEYACKDHSACVNKQYLCDGEDDCHDGSDEKPLHGCPPSKCGPDEFSCANGRCVIKSFLCDRVDDCRDSSDEPSSCTYPVCDAVSQFTCANKACLAMTAHCNGWPDCADGSDESVDTCPPRHVHTCGPKKWRCPQGTCISEEKLCDGVSDCHFEDELACNLNECMEGNGGCNQLCVDEKIHFHCGCYKGFRMQSDNRTCLDINECEEANTCSHVCVNTPGTYYCNCAPGYTLRPDKTTCKPGSGLPPYLLVANGFYIRNISLHVNPATGESAQKIVSRALTNAVSLDYDWKEKKIYWTDVTDDHHTISSMEMDGTAQQILHSVTTKHPDGLAVDWIGKNIYWSDNLLNTLEVSSLNGRNRRVLLRDVSEPRSLQLHPARGYLFYTDWGQGAHIGRVGMDGSSRKKIITDGIGWPNALAVDIYADRLFIGDAKLDYIAMTDLDGGNRKMILTVGVDHIFSLAVHDNWLFWSDWGSKDIRKAHKLTGHNQTTLITLIHRPMEIRVVHGLSQTYKGDNPCDALNCTGLCLLKPKDGVGKLEATCGCSEYYYLDNDMRTCKSNCSAISQFQCEGDTKCLHFTQTCDKHQDCRDGSDERNCDSKFVPCKPFQFYCHLSADVKDSKKKCVEAEQLCDGVNDCPQGDDEKIFGHCSIYSCMNDFFHCHNRTHYLCLSYAEICKSKPGYRCTGFNETACTTEQSECTQSEFRCVESGKCIPYVYHCDGEPDCGDASDEANSTCASNPECKPGYVSCNQSGQCIPESWQCDGDKDCNHGQDEDPEICAQASCPKGYFQCGDKKCIPMRWLCDYENDCRDGLDESNCEPRDCSESEIRCHSDQRCIHQSKKCDKIADCSDGSDEMACNRTLGCGEGYTSCRASGQCIPTTWKCDGTADCQDLSDETGCSDRHCAVGEFRCNNSLCISAAFKCDGQNDCSDGSDETLQLCEKNICLPDRFRCGNSKCIPVALLCDGVDDCGDKSDEYTKNCVNECSAGKFKCPNDGGCIDADLMCNGQVDCPYVTKAIIRKCINEGCPMENSNDEQNSDYVCRRAVGGCMNVHASMFFIRAFHRTKKLSNRCNGKIKCEDVKPSLVKITCEKGYQVNVKHALDHCRVCEDKNECAEYGSCSQLCNNGIGNYTCSCQPGFFPILSNRPGLRHDCVADDERAPYALIADGNVLRSYKLSRGNRSDSDERPSFMSYVNSTSRIDSVAVDLMGSQWTAYMLSYHTKSILKTDITSLLKSNENGGRRSKRHSSTTAIKGQTMSPPEVIRSGLGHPKSLTYDWIHGNLYWVDAANATISLLNVKKNLEATVVTPQSMLSLLNDKHLNPQSMTIDPSISAKIFWTDCCVRPRIWFADLDGKNPGMLTNKVEWPSGIVCDVSNQRLYWTDSKHRTVSTITVDGKDMRIIYSFTATDMQPNMIDVFGHELLVTTMDRTKVVTLDKFIGLTNSTHSGNITIVLNSNFMHIGDVSIVHPDKLYDSKRPVCLCGKNAIMTENFHGDNLRCSCLCADDYVKLNESDCKYCPCRNEGVCANQPSEPVRCLCPVGFGGDRCEHNLCTNYCSRDSFCEVFNGNPYCKCPPHMKGERCDRSKCTSGFCLNGGTCEVDEGGLVYCMCPVMYTGPKCGRRIQNMCEERCGNRTKHCANGHSPSTYICSCLPGYMGYDCHTCVTNINTLYGCSERGFCTLDKGQPTCNCTVGYFRPGTQCRQSICADQCLNGGTCVVDEETRAVSCSCPHYFTGEHCELRFKCVIDYCKNGGICSNHPSDPTKPALCNCSSGAVGDRCELSCQPACGLAQQCILQPNASTPVCVCPPGLQGPRCESTPQCTDYCLNGGTCLGCLATDGSDCSQCCQCSCAGDWKGDRCNTSVVDIVSVTKPMKPGRPLSTGTVAAVCALLVAVALIVIIVVAVIMRKRQRRRKLFEHLRLSEDRDDTMHVTNPMYMKSLNEDTSDIDEPDDDDFSVYSATNTSNFANPLYSLGAARKSKKHGDERTLLINHADEEDEQ